MRLCLIMSFVLCVFFGSVAASTTPLWQKPISPTAHRRMITQAGLVVQRIIKNYQLIKSLHFEALINGWIGSPKEKLAKRYIFWGADAHFRINYSVISPKRLRITNCEMAFDGRRYQYLSKSAHSLQINKVPPFWSQASLPVNPALEPASFLAAFWPIAIKVRGHGLSYRRLQNPRSTMISRFWHRFSRGGGFFVGHGVIASVLTVPGGTSREFSYSYQRVPHGKLTLAAASALFFPAGAPGGKGFYYIVTMSHRLQNMPRKIQVVTRLDKMVETMEFHYRKFSAGHSHVYVPSQIQKFVSGWRHRPSVKETIRLRHIVVNGALPPNIFVIDFHLANIVIDGKTKKILPVYHPPGAQ